jgi:hypothetical protein
MPAASNYGGEIAHLAMGGAIVFVIATLWLSRRHLLRAVRCALGRPAERGYDTGEPASYRATLLVLIVTMVVMVAWFAHIGLPFSYALALIVLTLGVFYVTTRVVAQCGLPTLSPPIYPNLFMASNIGGGNLSATQVNALALNYGWHFNMRNSAMAGAAHGMYLTRRRTGGLLWAMLLGLLITYSVATLWTVRLGYRHGAVNMDQWFFGTFPKYVVWPWANRMIAETGGPSYGRTLWAGGGAVLMTLLVLAQRTFFWWPFHPVGILIAPSHMVRVFWFSIFAAWLIKVGVVRLGGGRTYRIARRFMIGMVMGYFLAGGVWAILDTITGTTQNAVFYL